jgi:DNA-binding transcriptional LysR family regulator
MDRFTAMRSFATVVEEGSFAAAAARLGLSRAAVSRQVIELEGHLGARLLNRTTRRVAATEVGRDYHARCHRILDELAEAEQSVASLQAEPRGVLKANAPMSFGIRHLAPVIAAFAARCPDVRVVLSLNDRFVDLIEEGYDLAIRIGALRDSSLIARRLAPSKGLVCASPAYLTRRGRPRTPGELGNHSCLQYSYLASGATWKLRDSEGDEHSLRVSGPLCANNGDVLRQAALDGLGIAMLPTFLVGEDIRSGRLRRVLVDYAPPEMAIHAVYPPGRYLAPKVRSFIDFLAERFGPRPYWEPEA